MRRRSATSTVAAILGLAALGTGCGDDAAPSAAGGAADATRGQELFTANCAACHGEVADGTGQGPPLVHEVYEPSHHPDEAFQRAVADGVAPHHWEFGPMPPVSGLDEGEVADITAYVRQLQRDAGIE